MMPWLGERGRAKGERRKGDQGEGHFAGQWGIWGNERVLEELRSRCWGRRRGLVRARGEAKGNREKGKWERGRRGERGSSDGRNGEMDKVANAVGGRCWG
jgi:hypothetical protein